MSTVRFVAIGDSFTEGVGDQPDGRGERGWADLAAQGWAQALGESIQYANLAIRGKLAWPIVREQLEPALALKPTHLSFNAGGNDVLRPRADVDHIAETFSHVRRRCTEEGVTMIALSGANPSPQLPMRKLIQRRGDELSDAVMSRIQGHSDVLTAWNWPDQELSTPKFWSADRLHMNAFGHHRVAARVIDAVGLPAPRSWWRPASSHEPESMRSATYWRRYVAPWIMRRLTGRSSGDDRVAKIPEWIDIPPDVLDALGSGV